MPVALGGLAVRSAVDLSLPAFLSSVHACSTHVRKLLPNFHNILDDFYYNSAKILYLEKIGNNSSFLGNPSVQPAWDMQYAKLKLEKLISSSTSDLEKAKLLAVSSKQSFSWLNAIPIDPLGLKMNRSLLKISCALRLDSPLCIPHTCVCGTRVDQSGVHGLSCRKSAQRFSRHAQVNDIIKRALSSAHIPSILEPKSVSRSDGKRPDEITIYPWKNGRTMVWDFTCSDTIASSHIQILSAIPGKVSESAETDKLTKYRNLSADYEVIPIGVETFGFWSPNGLRLIREI